MHSSGGANNGTVERLEGELRAERATSAALRARILELEQKLGAKHAEIDGEQVVTCALHDIDARKRAEDQLRTTLRDLKHANDRIQETHRQLLYAEKMAVLGTLVAGIAHEIKTPIGAINSMQDTLLRAVEKLKRSLEQICPTAYEQNKQLRAAVTAIADANQVIESGSSRVLEIVKRLRSFARADVCELQQFDVHAGLDDTLLLLHHELKNRIELVKKYGAIPQIRASPGQLNQVFLNVLVNAAQAIPERGTITIQTTLIDDDVEVSIQDDGVGMSPENMARIFEPGFTTKSIGVGTGLGLAICKKIVSDHHGRIVLHSEAGQGTRVAIAIPADRGELGSENEDTCSAEAGTQESTDG